MCKPDSWSISPVCLAVFLVLFAMPALAGFHIKRELKTVLVADGRVAIESNGLTILDATTGEIIFGGDRESACTRPQKVPKGILVEQWSRRKPYRAKYGLLPEDGRSFAWSVDCTLQHLTDEHLICTESLGSGESVGPERGARVICRSLEDGRELWSHDTAGRIGEALDGMGRLMLTNEVWSEEHGNGRVTRLEVLELATGRVLATTDVDDVMWESWRDYRKHEFDGERVLLRRRKGINPGCPEGAVRIYTLDLSRQGFSARDDCEPVLPVTKRRDGELMEPHLDPVVRERTDEEKRRGARVHALEDGEIVVSPWRAGVMLELRSKRGHWQAFLDGTSRHPEWEFGKVFEQDSLLFIESNDWDFGTLDCIELTSGRPLWRFVFRADPVLSSTNRYMGPPKSYLIQECYRQRSLFRDLETSPPPAVAVVSDPLLMEREASFQPLQQADLLMTAPEPPTFEPFREGFTLRVVLWTSFVWGLVTLGVISMVCLLKKRFAVPGSTRRVWITLGLFLFLAAILVVFGRIEFYAATMAKILLVAVFMQAAFYALHVQVSRGRRLVRSAFGVMLIPMALLGLVVIVVM